MRRNSRHRCRARESVVCASASTLRFALKGLAWVAHGSALPAWSEWLRGCPSQFGPAGANLRVGLLEQRRCRGTLWLVLISPRIWGFVRNLYHAEVTLKPVNRKLGRSWLR